MNTLQLAAKLRPLMPKDVARWLRVRASADPETSHLIDEQIRASARRLLGDAEQQILLSVPPAKLIRGPIRLGTVEYAGDRGPAGLTHGDIMQNVMIVGRSGAGKTNATFLILQQLAEQGIPWLLMDWKRTGRHWAPLLKALPAIYTPGRQIAPLRFNPFCAPPALEPATYAGHIVDILADAYDLGDGAISVLQRVLVACYASGKLSPTVDELLKIVESEPVKGRAVGWTISATRALQSIQLAMIGEATRDSQSEAVAALMDRCTIVELDGLSASARRFLVPTLCLWCYQQQLATRSRERLAYVVVVEEAHHVLLREKRSGSESLMSTLLRQCREVGVGMIVVDQHPHLISPVALGNTAVTISLNLKDPSDVAKAAALCGVDGDDRKCFTMLPVGMAVVRLSDRWRQPFLVRLQHVPIDKGAVTDEDVRRQAGAESGKVLAQSRRSAGSPPTVGGSGDSGRIRQVAHVLSEDGLHLLEDVITRPDSGVRERYRRLALSGERGNRAKQTLLAGGWVEQQAITLGTGRLMLLRPTPLARSLTGGAPLMQGEGGLSHEYWRHVYARRLAEYGFDVEAEAPRIGGRMDLRARRGHELLAVEIETGASRAAANVRGCLRAGMPRVIVVATDATALAKVERQLASAGLLIDGRVHIALRDAWMPREPDASDGAGEAV